MKRKVLISVLTVALVLTLCIGLFAACDKTPAEPTQYKVTYDLGEYTGTEDAPAEAKFESGSKTTLPTLGFTWDKHKFTGWKAGEGALLQPGTEVTVTADITYVAQWAQFTADDYIGAWEGDRFHVEITKNGEAFQIEYDFNKLDLVASTSDQGGYTFHVDMDTAFDYDPADYHIWLIDGGAKLAICVAEQEADYTELTRAATFTEAYLGVYTGTAAADESLLAEIESASITLRLPGYGMLSHSLGSSTSKLEYAENGYLLTTRFMGEEGWENVTLHIYLDANNPDKLYVAVVTNDTDGTPYELTRKASYTITVHYTLGTEEKTATVNTMSGDGDTYYINNPLETLEDSADLMEQLEIGEFYEFYYYDADAADKKGEKFDIQSSFTATGDFDIIIIKATVGTLATSIDSAWYGDYEGMSPMMGPMTLTISADNGGTITFSAQYMPGSETTGQIGKSIFTNQGKLILAYFDEWQGGYTYYYFTRNAEDDSIQMTSDSGDIKFTRKAETPEGPTATVYYMLNGTLKSAPASVEASGDAYKLVDSPEFAIPEDGDEYDTFMGQLAFGQKLEYFMYNSATGAKEGTFDLNATFTEDISILVEFTTFATAADSIDSKYEGTFNGTCTKWGDFTLTISATDGTITLTYTANKEDTPNPIEASVEDDKIFTETDGGRLVFVDGSSAKYAHYYYLKEEGGAYTLECEYYTATLTKEGEEHTVTLKAAGQQFTVKVNDGATLTIPDEVPKEYDQYPSYGGEYNKSLHYWTDKNGAKFDLSTSITEDMTLTAVYHPLITFDLNGATGTLAPIFLETSQGNVKLPTIDPSAEDEDGISYDKHRFVGWLLDKTTYQGGESKMAYGNLTFVAQWKEIKDQYDVTFFNEGEEFSKTTVKNGEHAEAPSNTNTLTFNKEKTKYFWGWALKGQTTKFDFENTPIIEDIELEAIYHIFVMYDGNGADSGEAPAMVLAESNSSMGVPTFPEAGTLVKEGQKLVGWYLESAPDKVYPIGTEYGTGNHATSDSLKFFAKWVDAAKKVNVTYKATHASGEMQSESVDPYTSFTLPTPTYTHDEGYYYFLGWQYANGEKTETIQPNATYLLGESDITFTAVYSSELIAEKSSSLNLNVLKLDFATKKGTFGEFDLTFTLGEGKDESGYQDITITIDFKNTDKQHVSTATGKINIEKKEVNIVIYYDYAACEYGTAKVKDDIKTPLSGHYICDSTNLTLSFITDGTLYANGNSTKAYYFQTGEKSYISHLSISGTHYYLAIERQDDGSLQITDSQNEANNGKYTLGGGTEIAAKTYTKNAFQLTISADWKFKLVDGETNYDGSYFELYKNNYYAISGETWFKWELKDNGDIYCSECALVRYSFITFAAPIELKDGEVTYVGEASWKTSGFFGHSYVITKISIDPTKEVTTCIAEYSTDGSTTYARITISNSNYAEDFSGKYDGHTIKYYYQYNSGISFVIAIYDDGTLMIGDNNDNYLATFAKENTSSKVHITLKAGTGAKGEDQTIEVEEGEHEAIKNESYFTGKNEFWYFKGWGKTASGTDGDPDYDPSYHDKINYTEGLILYAIFNDYYYDSDNNMDVGIDIEHLDSEKGAAYLYDDNELYVEGSYTLNQADHTITLTFEGQSFKGTWTFDAEAEMISQKLNLNIEITYQGKTYTFGSGSTGEGTGESDLPTFADLDGTYYYNDHYIQLNSNGTCDLEYGATYGSGTYTISKGEEGQIIVTLSISTASSFTTFSYDAAAGTLTRIDGGSQVFTK